MKFLTPTLVCVALQTAAERSSADAERLALNEVLGLTNEADGSARSKHRKRAGKKLSVSGHVNVLQFNLGWESMSAIDFGSGKISSKHCMPGQYDAEKEEWTPLAPDMAAILRKMPFQRKEGKARVLAERVMDHYMSSCSFNMLENIAAWGGGAQYQLATFVELCSPGVNNDMTNSWGGFQESAEDENGYNARQCGLDTFLELQLLFPEHTFVLNNQPGKFGPVHQLTVYNPQVFGAVQHQVITQFTPGRPLTALFLRLEDEVSLVLNVHSIHFRKTLINPKGSDAELADGGFSEMMHFAAESVGKDVSIYADKIADRKVFSIEYFNTDALQSLFGSWIENQIGATLLMDPAKPCASKQECIEYAASLLEGDGSHIIMSGDFNDETGELTSIPLFGKRVQLAPDMRVRTCCSDRDPKWLAAYGQSAKGYETEPAYPKHAYENYKYLLEGCKYEGSCIVADSACEQAYSESLGELAVVKGKDKGAVTEIEGENSKYPFASDLILTTGAVEQFGFPSTYVQSMGEGAISDHDPVVAALNFR